MAKRVARHLLADPRVTPGQIIGLGHALYALNRLPRPTTGVAVEFGIVYRAGTSDFSEMRYIEFHIFEELFEICIGGSVYDSTVGSDSFSEPGWIVELGGYRNEGCDIGIVGDNIFEFIALGAKISVSDESEIEWE